MKKRIKTIGFSLVLNLIIVGFVILWSQYPIIKMIGLDVLILLLVVVGFVSLRPKLPPPPEGIKSVEALEAYLGTLVNHDTGSPPGLSLIVVKAGSIVYQHAFGMAGPRKKCLQPRIQSITNGL